MKRRIKTWLIFILVSQLIIKIILSTSPYSSFDEKEFINYRSKFPFYIPERALLLQSLSLLLPSLYIGRVVVALISSFSVFFLVMIEKQLFKKINFLLTSMIVFNPLFLKLSSMYLTDSIFFTLIVIFFYLKTRKKEKEAILITLISTLVRFEGFLLAAINLIELLLRWEKEWIMYQLLLSILFLPIFLQGINLYFTAHFKNINSESPYWYYFLTPFLITGFFAPFLPYSIIKKFSKTILLDLIFLFFIFFYFFTKAGGTFADRFRYVLPTLLPSSYYMVSSLKNRKIISALIILNLILLIPLYDYLSFRNEIKSLMTSFFSLINS